MLGSTKKLLNTARIYFDELGYSFRTEDGTLDYQKLFDSMANTINHCESFSNTIEAIKMFRYLDIKLDRIIDKIYKYPDYFDSLVYGKNEILSLVSDEESLGVYNITNAIFDKWSDVSVFSESFGQHFELMYENKRFSVYQDDSEYFLRYSLLSDEKMVLLDSNDEKLCVIKLNKDLEIELSNNYTDYEVNVDDGVVSFYKKGESQESEDNYTALMVWDIIEKDSKLGLVRLELYDEEADLEMLLLLATSCLLLYRGCVESSTTHAGLIAAITSSHIIRH